MAARTVRYPGFVRAAAALLPDAPEQLALFSMPEAPGDVPSGMACGRRFRRIAILSRTRLGTKAGARLAAQKGHRIGGLPTTFERAFGGKEDFGRCFMPPVTAAQFALRLRGNHER